MNITNSKIIALLLAFACLAQAGETVSSSNGEIISNSVADASVQNDSLVKTRKLWSKKKSWKKSKKSHKKKSHKYNTPKIDYLEAEIKDTGDKYDDINGWVHVDYDDKKLVINYHIEKGPKECDECKLAIYDGKKCKKIGDPHHDKNNDPWKVSKGAIFLSNKKGRAAGFFKLSNGYNLWRNRCKLVVLFDKNDKKIGCGKLIPEDKGDKYCK
jgi:hypothetical protein